MAGWEGLGPRLRQAIKDKGFVNGKGEADVQRFALAHGWVPNYIYRWINEDNTPDKANLDRLGLALGIAPAWLLFGDEVAKKPLRRRAIKALTCLVGAIMVAATGMVPGEAGTLPVAEKVNTSDNLVEVLCKLARYRRRAKFRLWSQFFVGVFPPLEAQPQAMWHAVRLA